MEKARPEGGRRMATVAMLVQSPLMHWHANCVCTDEPRMLVWGVSKEKCTMPEMAGWEGAMPHTGPPSWRHGWRERPTSLKTSL